MLILAQRIHQHRHPDHVFLSCDGTNAYNVFTRTGIARGILSSSRAAVRGLYPYFLMGHRSDGRIYFPGDPLPQLASRTGVRQGNPVSGAAYSLGQHAMLQALHEALAAAGHHVRSGAIVDDIGIQGTTSACAAARQWLVEEGPRWGYFLNEGVGKTTLCVGPAAGPPTAPPCASSPGAQAQAVTNPDAATVVTTSAAAARPPDTSRGPSPEPAPLRLVAGDYVAYKWQDHDGPDGEEAPMYCGIAEVLDVTGPATVDLHVHLNVHKSVVALPTELDLSRGVGTPVCPPGGGHCGRRVLGELQ